MSAALKYGARWDENQSPLAIELDCIARGGRWQQPWGMCGAGLYHHYKEAMTMLWPEDDWHRWVEMGLKAIAENDIVVLLGPGDSNKTYLMSKWTMLDWWADPVNTLSLVSTTERRGGELRIWGVIKELFNRGRERYPELPGEPLETLGTITYHKLDPEARDVARSLRSGIIIVPCLAKNQGLGRFAGMKAKRLRHVGDEVNAMHGNFLDAYSNWFGKPNFKGLMGANPLDPTGPEGIAAQPVDGWSSFVDNGKTQTWRSKFFDAFVLNYDGRDSPNDDYPQDLPPKYWYLIGHKKRNAVAKTYGTDSWQYSWQCAGKMRPGMLLNRVITPEMCARHHAYDKAVWNDLNQTTLYALDPAYGGGCRCLGRRLDFGASATGEEIIKIGPAELVPVNPALRTPVDDQIAAWLEVRLGLHGINPSNCFYDSFGKGTLGFAFAKVFGARCPVPVDSGARPTARPVRFDEFIRDEESGEKRLKRCDEHYSKFVTEMWFSVTEAVLCDQMRELSEETAEEGSRRMFTMVQGGKIEVESKDEFIERTGFSPDDFDCAAIGVEGARRLGFKIRHSGVDLVVPDEDYFDTEARQYDEAIKGRLLQHR